MNTQTKADLIEKLTTTASEVLGTPTQFFTVLINEHDDANIGLGGENLISFKARLKADKSE